MDVGDDLAHVEEALEAALADEPTLVAEVTGHLLKSGGKRLRPALVLLGGHAGTYRIERLAPVAAAAELIHTATLVHDDIIDAAATRRGAETVSRRWDQHTAVLAGDWLFAKAFSILSESKRPAVVGAMAAVVFQMCSGEIQQNLGTHRPLGQDEAEYLSRIGKKTAEFIGQACRVGALMSDASAEVAAALYQYGFAVGMGFQIVDDLLDMTADAKVLGKATGSDLRAGVYTLPVIYALQQASGRERLLGLCQQVETLGDSEMDEVTAILQECGAFGYAQKKAQGYITAAKAALSVLGPGELRDELFGLADGVLSREL